ncbi:MAG: hypothetical protein K8R59_02725 [Thermoanaerobaculales bacterium]|nr:hypothetical protein [Thermoanaerobaculales bacterium]
MEPWLASFEVQFPASTTEELLLALVVRDLVHGSSFDVESEESGEEFQVDVTASDEIQGEEYQLLMEAEINGTDKPEIAQAFLEQVLEEAVSDGDNLIVERRELDSADLGSLEFGILPEDEERWDLVIPDWLAPEGAEVPFGFRSFRRESGEAFPSNADLDQAGRIILVPDGDVARFFAIPAVEAYDEGGETALPTLEPAQK